MDGDSIDFFWSQMEERFTCRGCLGISAESILNLGRQPICNRLSKSQQESLSDDLTRAPINLGVCLGCGLVQLINPVCFSELTPIDADFTYHEPEGHLDILAEKIAQTLKNKEAVSITGVSYRDESLIRRLAEKGFSKSLIIDPCKDLAISAKFAGVEWLQHQISNGALTPPKSQSGGECEVLIVRRVLEHAYRLPEFLLSIKNYIGLNGFAVIEVPDNSKVLSSEDYSFLWEDHLSYFTPTTFVETLGRAGFEVIAIDCYEYTYENSLVAIVKIGSSVQKQESEQIEIEVEQARHYAWAYPRVSAQITDILEREFRATGAMAIVGAGHLSAMFLNLYNAAKFFSMIVDDASDKCGRFMPGSGIEIRSSRSLLESEIQIALLSLSPESEKRFIEKQTHFEKQGRKFRSIFRLSSRAILPI